jgi:ADP-ribose pyrophosphatase YjhB (NUDIX family)
MTHKREYPERPVVGVGGVVIRDGRVLLVRRGSEPLKGEWSIPGGTLELGETIAEGVVRELREETGLDVRVLDLIEVFERIFPGEERPQGSGTNLSKYKYHFVILDYLCEAPDGMPQPGSDVTDVAFAGEDELATYHLTPTATRVIRSAFRMARERGASALP